MTAAYYNYKLVLLADSDKSTAGECLNCLEKEVLRTGPCGHYGHYDRRGGIEKDTKRQQTDAELDF